MKSVAKVLLTGGTGFVGKHLGKSLVRKGYEVVVVTRNPKSYQGTLPYPCEYVAWKDLQAYLKSNPISHVIHLAGESVAGKRWNTQVKKEIYDSRVKSTQNLIDALKESQSPVQTFISASAIGFYGDRGEESLHEKSEVGQGYLSEVCKAWEDEIFKAEKIFSNARVAALRIGIVLGDGGGALAEMLPPFRDGYGAALGNGRQWMSWIHIEDLISLFVWSLENKKTKGVYNAVSPEAVRNLDFSYKLSQYFKTPLLPKVPSFALRTLVGEMSRVILSSQKVVPRKALDEGFEFKFGFLDKALTNILEPLKPFETKVIFEQWVPHTIEKLFPFYENEQNLEQITPPWLNFKVLGKSTPQLQAGTLIEYKLSFRGIPMHWQTLIESFEKNKSFVDTQKKGPYQKWHHTHEFEALANGTIVRDIVRYKVPLSGIGYAASSWLVHKDVKNIFDYRAHKIAELFCGVKAQ